jgi:hypothetical protein
VYKVLILQKQGTDPTYRFADSNLEPLGLDDATLSESERRRMEEIEKRLAR